MSRTHVPVTEQLADYISSVTLREPEFLRRLRDENASHPQAEMQTAPEQAQFLFLLTKMIGAKKALEVGVFMGYSSTWVALALPADGKIIACDVSEEFTARARQAWRESGVEHMIDLRLGPAVDTLDKLIAEGHNGTFDFAFIDADKISYPQYYERALKLLRQGGVMALDNVFRHGKVADPTVTDADTENMRAFNAKLHKDPRIVLSMIPLGDGLTVACKL